MPKMIKVVFYIVAKILVILSHLTGYTYNQINILVFYFVIPFTWMILIDMILHSNYLKISFVIFCFGFYFGCENFRQYSDKLFTKSVSFLNYFNKYGSTYKASSVLICFSLPLIIYGILISLVLIK